jgi:hypothetical protein
MNFSKKYYKYYSKLFGGSSPALAFTKNQYLLTLDPNTIDDDLALKNGEFLFNYLKVYLNNEDRVKQRSIPALLPSDTVDPTRIKNIITYFSSDENKRWLARQMYLVNSYSGVIDDSYAALQDDVMMFLNWLTNRNAYKAPMMSETLLKI